MAPPVGVEPTYARLEFGCLIHSAKAGRVPAFTMRAMGLCAWAIPQARVLPSTIWRRLLAYRGWVLLQPSANFDPMPVSPSFLRPCTQGFSGLRRYDASPPMAISNEMFRRDATP